MRTAPLRDMLAADAPKVPAPLRDVLIVSCAGCGMTMHAISALVAVDEPGQPILCKECAE